jgi:hypothetical protein
MFGSSERVLELLAERERIDAQLLVEVGAWAASREYAADGAATATSWLVNRGDMSSVEAARLVRNGRLVHTHQRTAKLLDSGDISPGHVDVMARAARNRESCFDEHEETLLDAARALPVQQFRTVARRWRVLADDVLATEEAANLYDGRYLHASKTLNGGVRIDGLLDPEGGAWLLGALAERMGTDTTIPAAQRRADALVALARGKHSDVRLDVLIDHDTLTGEPPADLTRARSDLAPVGPVAPETLRRLACDARIGRIVCRGPSEILDVGRSRRIVTRAQRRALDARDGGCVFPGCDRLPGWCDAHHLVHWIDGGTTDLDNLTLLCRHHHTFCHERRWVLVRDRDGTVDARPP